MTISIWHNPRCSKSRQTLGLIEEKGITPTIILYLENAPDADEIKRVLKLLARTPRELMRKGESAYKENNLGDASLSDDALVEAMAADPSIIERPIVITDNKARVGRPPEDVLEIL
jgi:arsenate reductase